MRRLEEWRRRRLWVRGGGEKEEKEKAVERKVSWEEGNDMVRDRDFLLGVGFGFGDIENGGRRRMKKKILLVLKFHDCEIYTWKDFNCSL